MRYQLLVPSSDDYLIKIESTGSVVPFHSLSSNACGTFALFLWKYVLDVMRNKKRCISITYRPYLSWEIPESLTERVEPETDVFPEVETIVVESAT